MKNKGIFFLLMGLILSLLVLGFGFKINQQYLEAEKKSFNSNALQQVKNKYSNINSVKDFYREGTIKTYFERIVPITYSVDENTISITQQLPIKKALVRNFFDFVNAFEIFTETTDSLVYDGIDVEIETVQNSLWGGTDENIVLMIKPQCKKYSITDYNSMHFYGSNECDNAFDISLIERIDINITVSSDDDFNRLSCNFGGDLVCYQETYVPANPNPFIEINLIDSACPNCDLNSDTRTIKKHFTPTSANTVIFSCSGTCTSLPIEILFNENNTEIRHSGTTISVKTEFLFTDKITEFELNDLNISLTDSKFSITKTNK